MSDDLMSKAEVRALYARQLRRLYWVLWAAVAGAVLGTALLDEYGQALGQFWVSALTGLNAGVWIGVAEAAMRRAASAGEAYGGWKAFRQVNLVRDERVEGVTQSEIARGMRKALEQGAPHE